MDPPRKKRKVIIPNISPPSSPSPSFSDNDSDEDVEEDMLVLNKTNKANTNSHDSRHEEQEEDNQQLSQIELSGEIHFYLSSFYPISLSIISVSMCFYFILQATDITTISINR